MNLKNIKLSSLKRKGKEAGLLLSLLLTSNINMSAAQKVDRIDPTNWFVGMKNPQV